MAIIDIDNSIQIDWNISYKYVDSVNSVVKQLFEEIVLTGKAISRKTSYREHLRVIILNLYNCYIIDPDMSVYYSRNRSKYKSIKRYAPFSVSYTYAVDIIDALIEIGYAIGKLGHYDRSKAGAEKGKESRVMATRKLIELMMVTHKISRLGLCRSKDEEAIVLKDADKNRIDYKDKDYPGVAKMRKNLGIINGRIASSFIGLRVHDEELRMINSQLRLKKSEENEDLRSVVDFSRTTLRRVFNNGSFHEGGRFYNGWWQEVPSRFRSYIRIDDEKTREIDFSGYHINLIYAIEGLPLPTEDVYAIPGIPVSARKILKDILQILVNSVSRESALKAIRKKCPARKYPEVFDKGKGITHASLVDAFMEKHSLIYKYFHSGEGVKLQFIDSQIAEEIMLRLGKKGIVVLPIHDSFIVKERYIEELAKMMNQVMTERYKQEFKLKYDVSAYEADRRFLSQEVLPEDLPKSEDEYEGKWVSLDNTCLYFRMRDEGV